MRNRNISKKEMLRMMKEYFDNHTDNWLLNRLEEQRLKNEKQSRESLHEILNPTVVDCNVSEVLKWDGLNE